MRVMRKSLWAAAAHYSSATSLAKRPLALWVKFAKATLLVSVLNIGVNSALAETATDAATNQTPHISVAVQQAHQAIQQYSVAQGSRLSQLISQLSLSDNDYWYATAWLRHGQALKHQQKKSTLLTLVDQQIAKQDKYAEQWRAVKQQIAALVPTDRFTIAVHPDRVYADGTSNYLLHAQDKIIIPARPSTISITGFATSLNLDHQPSQDLNDYLKSATMLAMADNSIVWLIKPDTTTLQLPIAYWNKLNTQTLAPGSIIFVPAKTQIFSEQHQQINQLYLELLQNQIIGSPQGE
ncbi:capsule biosynthesis GfcC family protein [Agarivorans sp. TSD2052]|uniref:capsule biosynthesis GfcC family protein n=1 Tax=Agarivorans sp. TSD2052 TaxID=2937286 RepID=UPI00200DBB7A|nr:capsule biosynthesis GfcC family protein [Agarivorans sp. TSD2052]UPW20088.1 capsule biosynthesis GfcC family protein [Agarivorans sp. TSD2052]